MNSAQLSADCVREARESVLAFFRAPPEYTVVFTANATAALKLVGESFPFTKNGTYVLGADSHNSLHGIREFSYRAGSQVVYIESTSQGGLNESLAKVTVLGSSASFLVTEPQITVRVDDPPAAFERECKGFVCPHRHLEHFQQQKSLIADQICFEPGLFHLARCCRARSSLHNLALGDPCRRNGRELLQDVWLPDRCRRASGQEVILVATQAAVVFRWERRRCAGPGEAGHEVS